MCVCECYVYRCVLKCAHEYSFIYKHFCAHACLSGHKLSSVHVNAFVCILMCMFKCLSVLKSVYVDTRVLFMCVCELCAHRSVCMCM